MAYDKFHDDWQDYPSQTTAVTAEALEHIEEGIFNASVAAEAAAAVAAAAETPAGAQAKADAAKARNTHIGTQSADTITDGVTNVIMTAVERAKLTAVAAGATANATNAQLRDRATHTGTQSADTITDGATNKVLSAANATLLTTLNTLHTNGLVVARHHDASTGWPVRGTLPANTVVLWINRNNTTPPSAGGTGYVDGVDIILMLSS